MPKWAVLWKVVFFQRPRGRCFSRGLEGGVFPEGGGVESGVFRRALFI